MERPKFGSQTTGNIFSAPIKNGAKKEEIGAIWTKKTKTNDDLLTIRLTKDKLKSILDATNDGAHVRLVAYHNNKTSEKQPNFRIYEDSQWEKK